MRKKKSDGVDRSVLDYRYDSKRKNIPPAALAAQGKVREAPKLQFQYDPHLPPVLRFDPTGAEDRLPELLEEALSRPLKPEEARQLAEALRNHEPWLEWSGKREKKSFEVDPVALHIHERVSTQAVLKVAARQDVQRSLFADPQLEYVKAVQFYQHDVDWANRMILGDSLQVMASLARREDLAGKVQMIYMDPPYGIKFASNFQPEIGRRDVKDRDADLTREPEMVKAYRDTWTLGVHSYLAYLRDRLYLCKELLADSGSIFVQIGDENVNLVRDVMEQVFGRANFVVSVAVKKKSVTPVTEAINDYLLWFAKDRAQMRVRLLTEDRDLSSEDNRFTKVEFASGGRSNLELVCATGMDSLPDGARVLSDDYPMVSQDPSPTRSGPFQMQGRLLVPGPNRHWTLDPDIGMRRVEQAGRLRPARETARGVVYSDDFPRSPIANVWDFHGERNPVYVVQTNKSVVERCLLMTTDPGDLVLDPTCGSGTTAYVAEQWGRRWITIDTSRVAISLARQRLMTATYPLYKVNNGELDADDPVQSANPANGFIYKKVPHITLKSIAQNAGLDPIFAKHAPILEAKLAALNEALSAIPGQAQDGPEGRDGARPLRTRLAAKLAEKEKREGKKSVTDADGRRWLLPPKNRASFDRLRMAYTTVPNDFPGWYEWEVPFDTDEDWPPELAAALEEYRAAWRAKMDEVNACIAANAEMEELVDQPEVVPRVLRVSGPFTVEAVMPAEESLGVESPIGGEPDELETFAQRSEVGDQGSEVGTEAEPQNAEAYLDRMLRLLRTDGVRFPNNKVVQFKRLEPCSGEWIHAEGEWDTDNGKSLSVAVSFGPEFGPVTAYQVENALRSAYQRGFDALVFAGFSFDAAAQAVIQEDPNPRVRCHMAHIRPDVNMGDLLKETPTSQIFTVFGSPRMDLRAADDGLFEVEMQGVDIYDPVENSIRATGADKVAAWFLDTDYDGHTFCITQAFFPDRSAWNKLERALKGVIDEGRFDVLSGTVSLPFPPGTHGRVAMKVIDPRGNEVMCVRRLPTAALGQAQDEEAVYGET